MAEGRLSEVTVESFSSKYAANCGCREALLRCARSQGLNTIQPFRGGNSVDWMMESLWEFSRANKLEEFQREIEGLFGAGEIARDIGRLVASKPGFLRLWHLSDLHFGRLRRLASPDAAGEEYPLAESILALLTGIAEERKPDLIAVTGDMSWQSDVWQAYLNACGLPSGDKPPEFPAAASFCRRAAKSLDGSSAVERRARVLVVPGNHDVPWLGETNTLDTFQTWFPTQTFVTPFTRTRPNFGADTFTARSQKGPDGASVCVAKYLTRGIDLVVVLIVSHYYEGKLPEPETNLARRVHSKIKKVRRKVADHGWPAISRRELKSYLEMIKEFGIHDPIVTSGYSDTVRKILRLAVGAGAPPINQVRICLSHAPFVQIASATRDIAEGGESFLRAQDLALGEEDGPAFHAVCCGHLHAARSAPLTDGGYILCAGTATSQISPDKLPTQGSNSFGELNIGISLDGPLVEHVPWVWRDGTWDRFDAGAKYIANPFSSS